VWRDESDGVKLSAREDGAKYLVGGHIRRNLSGERPDRRALAGKTGTPSYGSLNTIDRTLELGERLHVDLGAGGLPVGVEILYSTLGEGDLEPLRDRFGWS
jgi:hypothetical protein